MYYVTTPIYYVNDDPHVGHIYTTLCADVLCRFSRLAGQPSFLLTGTDEHATKVVDAALARHLTTAEWAQRKASVFAEAFDAFGIQYDDFIRTSQQRHLNEVRLRVEQLIASDDIYLGVYEGWYDAGQEEYVPTARAEAAGFISPINKKPLVRRSEKCFFFRLSRYGDQIRKLIESDELAVRPPARRAELLARLRDELYDVPCSRPRTTDWGVAVPGDESQVVYVWIDALLNYLTAVDTAERRPFWPPSVQIVGKDILWFHAVIWPAMLLALSRTDGNHFLALPKAIRAHSFWVRDGEKMSKSLGNFLSLKDLTDYAKLIGRDAIRYFLVVAGPNDAVDADFSLPRLQDSYTSALANTVGNTCSRILAMIGKYCGGRVPKSNMASGLAIGEITECVAKARQAMDIGEFPELNVAAQRIFRVVNTFIHDSEPFKLAKDPSRAATVAAILADTLESIRLASLLLWPIMPERIGVLWNALGLDVDMAPVLTGGHMPTDSHFAWGQTLSGRVIGELPPLFPRVDLVRATVAEGL